MQILPKEHDGIIDYTSVPHMTFAKLEKLEIKRQGRKDRKLKDVKIRLLCDCCGKPFVRLLHDIRLAFSFCCGKKCVDTLHRRVRQSNNRFING